MANFNDNSPHSDYFYESDDSTTSSIFGYYCEVCSGRASSANDLEIQYLTESVYMVDNDLDIWLKCDNCGDCFHKKCWESLSLGPIGNRFVCCEYILIILCCFVLEWVVGASKRKATGGVPLTEGHACSSGGQKICLTPSAHISRSSIRRSQVPGEATKR